MTALSRVGEIVRRHDPDRFFTALFAPPDRREALFTLYAFNGEIARAREVAREPMMAFIRLQWWREVVEGAHRRHEVAGPVSAALDAGTLAAPDLLALIEGREAEPPRTAEEWRQFVRATGGRLALAAGRVLGAGAVPALGDFGSAYGAAGILRNAALGHPALNHAALGHAGPPPPGLAEAGLEWLAAGRSAGVPRLALAAGLPAVFARRDLRRTLKRATPVRERGAGDKLAVLLAAITGRL